MDSIALLHAMAAEPRAHAPALRALHVDHGLHPCSAAWARHCAEVCDALQIALTTVRVTVAVDAGVGREAAARDARMRAFRAHLGAGEHLALAHHRDDQAETFLLRALRGSGVDGLAGMRPLRPLGHGWLWRPWLGVPREAIRAWATAAGLRWVDDPSNTDESFDRNFLRHRVMPLLRDRWPAAHGALSTSAELAAQAAALLAHDDADALVAATTAEGPGTVSIAAIAALPQARRARVLRHWVAGLGLPPLPGEGIRVIERELLPARPDALACFAWHGAEVRAWRGRLFGGLARSPLPDDWTVTWDGRSPLPLPGGGLLRLEPATAFAEIVRVRARSGGESIQLAGRRHRHALKDLLQQQDVPPWRRRAMPVLCASDGEVLAAGGIAGARMAAWLDASGSRLVWEHAGT